MKDMIALAFGAMLIENVVLSQFFGICPFLGVSKKKSSAVGMGLAVIAVIVISSIVAWALYNFVLVKFDLVYLQTIVFILVIASLVQILEMFIKKVSPSLYKALGVFLPLITTNCAVLGTANAVISNQYDFANMFVYSLFTGIGFLFVMFIFSGLREKIEKAPVPKAFKGAPIALIAASALAVIFARLGGII